jgi:O-antigen/teichoic acid export membrane protein
VLYTVLARCFAIIGSIGTVLLIAHCLSSVEQGYYYTLLSLITLQTIFELGFSFVILQLAAHESVHLKVTRQSIDGNKNYYERLALIFQLTVKWYAVAAMVMLAVMLPLGDKFFSHRAQPANNVVWQWPWMLAVLFTSCSLLLTPMLSFLEGCGEIRQVASVRMQQSVASAIVAWAVFLVGKGLYSPSMVVAGQCIVGLFYLWKMRRPLLTLWKLTPQRNIFSWRLEVWPFQWRIAASWSLTYLTAQVFTPVLFIVSGPISAGRMGMSMSIAGYMWNVILPWMSTKATPFGQMVERREFDKLDGVYFRTMRQAVIIMIVLCVMCFAGILFVQYAWPRFAQRMLSTRDFALLLITALCTLITQCEAVYLRAFKREPFLEQSVVVAALTCILITLLVPRWGTSGAATTYFLCAGVVGVSISTYIFRQRRIRVDCHANEN